MKAIRMKEFGAPEVMIFEEVPDLKTSENEILIDVKAIGVNPVDVYMREGTTYKPSLPLTPGLDAAGVIEAIDVGVHGFRIGERIFVSGSISGTYAQKIICKPSQVHRLSSQLSFEQGAAIGIPYAGAYRALFQKAKAVANETVLVHGASGGVGLAAVQLAKAAGLKVMGTAGSEKGRALIIEQGAQLAFDHHKKDYLKEIMDATEGRGPDIILEMLSNVNLGNDLAIAGRNSRIVIIGSRGTVTINPRDAMSHEIVIYGMMILSAAQEEMTRIYDALSQGFDNGSLKPVIDKKFSLKDAPLAHKAVMEKGHLGKIILIP